MTLAEYPDYTGFDISPTAIKLCLQRFPSDPTKRFRHAAQYAGESADLTLSLDVVYHLTEDRVFHNYMSRLFEASKRYVVIYSSNQDYQYPNQNPHVRHRPFTAWIANHRPDFQLIQMIPNRFPYQHDKQSGSFADFYFFEKISTKE